MKINVGSKNQNKVQAVREIFLDFPNFKKVEVFSIDVNSEVSKQPKNIKQTVQGAMNRAKNSFNKNCDFSVGLESGLMKVPNTKSGYMDITMCAIYDGKKFHLGGSSAFEYPKEMIDLIFAKDYEVDEAAKEMGVTQSPKLGKEEGMVDYLLKAD